MGYGSTGHDLLSIDNVLEDSDVVTELPSTIISQYAHSQRVTKLAKYIHERLDQEDVFQSLFSEAFNVETAEGVFLDQWGAIVGVKRTTTLDGVTYKLDDATFRELIMFRTAMNVSEASIVTINDLLSDLFEMPIAVVDNGDMTMRIFIDRGISNVTLTMLKFYGFTLKPAGVGYEFVLTYDGTLGFFGQKLQTFNHGMFNTNPMPVEANNE